MIAKPYEDAMLFMGVLSTEGLPDDIKDKIEKSFGPVSFISSPIPFDFTDYYNEEMGGKIERFFIAFDTLISPDKLADAKTVTDGIELEHSPSGKRSINLDPGLITESNVVLATTKNRAHRIAIGQSLYAEVTLIYHRHGFESFPWTYADYRSEEVQKVLVELRNRYLLLRRLTKRGR
ncbi:MAG: DUF4416 family protein [Spirochaetes bacterium]|uniref:DUF4416 family protein n=1 Tax=Candidatus Ornithospirochaeta stercoripullorum TaxID=2840899 RepID=A0A9D9H2D7_9SPIO|nr:DUF4416 family protein [Candidatus Ornithospirochaeta stercoripullorum]